MPRFKLEASFGLNSTLEAMGMKRAFSREADFSGISSAEGSLHLRRDPQGLRGRQRGGHGGGGRDGRGDGAMASGSEPIRSSAPITRSCS